MKNIKTNIIIIKFYLIILINSLCFYQLMAQSEDKDIKKWTFGINIGIQNIEPYDNFSGYNFLKDSKIGSLYGFKTEYQLSNIFSIGLNIKYFKFETNGYLYMFGNIDPGPPSYFELEEYDTLTYRLFETPIFIKYALYNRNKYYLGISGGFGTTFRWYEGISNGWSITDGSDKEFYREKIESKLSLNYYHFIFAINNQFKIYKELYFNFLPYLKLYVDRYKPFRYFDGFILIGLEGGIICKI